MIPLYWILIILALAIIFIMIAPEAVIWFVSLLEIFFD